MDPATRRGVRAGLRLALEHHPLCWNFAHDRFRLGRIQVCSGCAIAFPSFVTGLLAGFWAIFGLQARPLPLLAAGLMLGLPQLTTYLRRHGRALRGAVKAVGGIGMGLVMAAWPFLPFAWTWKWAGLVAFGLALGVLQAIRVRSILRKCRACPWNADWDNCPGLLAAPDRTLPGGWTADGPVV